MRISDWSSEVCSSDLGALSASGDVFGWLLPEQFFHQACHRQGMLSLQNHRSLTQLFAVESVALVPEREDDEMHSDFDGYGDDPAKTFTHAPQNGPILPGMATPIDEESSVRPKESTAQSRTIMRPSYP